MAMNYQLFGFMFDYPMRSQGVKVYSMESKLGDITNLVHQIGPKNATSVTVCGIFISLNLAIKVCFVWEDDYSSNLISLEIFTDNHKDDTTHSSKHTIMGEEIISIQAMK